MKAPLAAAVLLLLAGPARAGLFGGSDKETVVWVPAEGFSDWAKLETLLQRRDDVRLTIGLSPSMLTAEAKRALAPAVAYGRVEGALRLDGDPLLPLIAGGAAPRPDDITTRLADERERFRVAFGSAPAGVLPGAGALEPELFNALRATGFAWAGVGEYAPSTGAWAADGLLTLVPLREPRTEGRELASDDVGLDGSPAAYVVDEADGLVPQGSFLRLLDGARAPAGWGTVAEAVKARAGSLRSTARIARWPAWTGGLEAWTDGPRAKRAWKLYALAAEAVDRYQNSGSADLRALESASAELYAAQASRFYRELPAGEAESSARAFRQHLLAVFRKLKEAPPDELFADGGPADSAQDQPSAVRITQGAGWVQFDNPPGSLGRAPAGFQLEEGGAPGDAFRLESLRVRAGDDGLSLTFKLAKLDAAAPLEPRPEAAPDLGRVMIEAYLDLNHVAGAGTGALLSDRGTFVMARDAWEFALSVSAWGACLYKSNPLGSPQQIARLAPVVEPSAREVRVTIPRSLLRGSALRWGYTVVTEAADPATAKAGSAVKALRQGDASAVRGLLGSLEQQKALFDAKPGSRPRLNAVRAD